MTPDAAPHLIPNPPVGVAVIGVGLMGAHHAENLAHRVPGARLVGLADPQPGLAERHAARLGCPRWTLDYQQLLADPAVEAVVIATPAPFHAEVIVAAALAGKAVFCEKPIAHRLADADRAIAATRNARVLFQIGFQRRFDREFVRARDLVNSGGLGRIQFLRSLTRDPSLDEPERVPPGAIFRETLIHDFDVLRFLAGGAEPVEVYAMADALVLPDWKSRGLLDSAVVALRYDSGALATADASFQAVYGYDVPLVNLVRLTWSTTPNRVPRDHGCIGSWTCSARPTPPSLFILSPEFEPKLQPRRAVITAAGRRPAARTAAPRWCSRSRR